MYEDSFLEEAYEDRFFIEDTDEDDGFTFGWSTDEDEETE